MKNKDVEVQRHEEWCADSEDQQYVTQSKERRNGLNVDTT